jgi:hypothetical protein
MRSVGRYLARHHWGLLATFIALSGTAYASSQLPANSVGTEQLRRHAVTLAKISPSAETVLRHGQPPRSASATAGYYFTSYNANQNDGLSGSVSLTVPAGNYIAVGGCTVAQSAMDGAPLAFGSASATLYSSAQPPPPAEGENRIGPGYSTDASVPNQGSTIATGEGTQGNASLSDTGGFELPKGGKIIQSCQGGSVGQFHLVATRVGRLSGSSH